MKRRKRTGQGFSPMTGVRTLWETELRRSDIFIDNPPPNKRQLRRSGILGRVASPENFKPSNAGSGCRSDVAPTELGAIYLPRCYKDVAPTELQKGFLRSSQT
jgi:hypothetical protein